MTGQGKGSEVILLPAAPFHWAARVVYDRQKPGGDPQWRDVQDRTRRMRAQRGGIRTALERFKEQSSALGAKSMNPSPAALERVDSAAFRQ